MVDAQGPGGALVEGDLSGRKAHDPQGEPLTFLLHGADYWRAHAYEEGRATIVKDDTHA